MNEDNTSPIPIIFFQKLEKKFRMFCQKILERFFGNFMKQQIFAWEVWSIHQMKAKITCNWPMKLILRFTLEKVEELKNHSEIFFWNFICHQILTWEVWSIHQMKARITCNWLIKLYLRFNFKKLEKLSFQKIIPKFFDGTSWDFLLESSNKWW